MKTLKVIFWLLLLLCLPVAAYKAAVMAGRANRVSFIAPASLDSFDPFDRAEAARDAAKKFGGSR